MLVVVGGDGQGPAVGAHGPHPKTYAMFEFARVHAFTLTTHSRPLLIAFPDWIAS